MKEVMNMKGYNFMTPHKLRIIQTPHGEVELSTDHGEWARYVECDPSGRPVIGVTVSRPGHPLSRCFRSLDEAIEYIRSLGGKI
jgi:hypothetical protein